MIYNLYFETFLMRSDDLTIQKLELLKQNLLDTHVKVLHQETIASNSQVCIIQENKKVNLLVRNGKTTYKS